MSTFQDYFDFLRRHDNSSVYQGFAVLRNEAGHLCLSISLDTTKQVKEVRKFAQLFQTPKFRFVSLEPISEVHFNGISILTPNRFQYRFRVVLDD